MAGIYPPIITSFGVAFLKVESQDATSYDEIQQSLVNTIYLAENVEITGGTIEQVTQPVLFESYNVNGDLKNYNLTPTVDPYQYQGAVQISLSSQEIVFDGKTKMNIQVLPNNSAVLDFNVAEVSTSGVDDLGDALDDEALSKIYDETIFKGIEKFQQGVEDMYDYDFMNRTGFFTNINTTLSECYPKKLDDLFADFREEL